MATRIVFYKTGLIENRSMIIDKIDQYLSTCESWRYPYQEVQFIKPGFETSITLDLKGFFSGNYNNPSYEKIVSQDSLYDYGLFDYNYLEVYNATGYSLKDTLYYFVTKREWLSKNTIKIYLRLDVLNSYLSNSSALEDISIQGVQIIRQHVDRFSREKSVHGEYGWSLVRKVDKENENISVPKFLVSEHNAFNLESFALVDKTFPDNWYLVYKNKTYEPGSKNERLPIEVQCFYDDDIKVKTGSIIYGDKTFSNVFTDFGKNKRNMYILDTYYKGGTTYPVSVKVGQHVYYVSNSSIIVFSWGIGDTQVSIYKQNYENGRFISRENLGFAYPADISFGNCQYAYEQEETDLLEPLNVIRTLKIRAINSGAEGDYYIPSIKTVDKTDPKLIKIIKLPYAPTSMFLNSNNELEYESNTWYLEPIKNTHMKYLEMYDFGAEFLNMNVGQRSHLFDNVLTLQLQPTDKDDFNYLNESKLLNSEFTSIKLMYDDFEYEFPLEYNKLNISATHSYSDPSIRFKVTNTINSNFIFRIDLADFDTPLAYPNFLNVRRNNEMLILNSPYLNYVNNGYNYDKKHRKMDITTGIIGNTIGLAGQGIAMATGGVSGSAGVLGAKFGSSLINDAISTITSAVKSEDALKQRLVEMNNASVNIQGSDDIDLLSFYTDNKLWYKCFMVREEIAKDIAYLFHLTGYSYPHRDYPDFYSRYWFNFVQFKPIFDAWDLTHYGIPEEFIEYIIEKFETGVTLFHGHNNYWDLEQYYENYETWIMEV